MKTKIFLAFITVILAALFSNFIFEWLIMKDFDNYVNGVKQDQFRWIQASVESCYSNGRWDRKALSESIHWAMMLGLDMKVSDIDNKEIMSSHEVMGSLSDVMRQRMEGLFHMHANKTESVYDERPLYIQGKRIGTLFSRELSKEQLKAKEDAFRKRTKNFIFVSFLIAGSGLLLLALLFSQYLSKPIMSLKLAAEKIANGDFTARTDLTSHDEVGQLSGSFNKMAESLQREEELRKRLLSNIAHELRTPLTILKTHTEAIADGVIDRKKGLENIRDEIDKLIKLVKGIEDLTAAEASFFTKGEITEVNLKEFLSELSSDMLPAFREKGLGIDISGGEDLYVTVDINKLERIIRNILSNAIKFTEKGGVLLGYGIKGKNFFIEIKDSGIGIPEDEVQLIFNRFYRGKKTSGNGLGLGLAIVKELVDILGGKIEVTSKTGEGTTFRIFLAVHSASG